MPTVCVIHVIWHTTCTSIKLTFTLYSYCTRCKKTWRYWIIFTYESDLWYHYDGIYLHK